MKKILKYFVFLFVLFSGFNINAFETKVAKKNFCDEDMNYMYLCNQTEAVCVYQRGVYVKINKTGDAKFTLTGETGEIKEITNWGRKDKMSIDAKAYYKKNKQCPRYLFVNNNNYYMTSETNANKDYKAVGGPQEKYSLMLVMFNTHGLDKNEDQGNKYLDVDSCAGFTSETDCKVGITAENGKFGCAWNKDYKFCSPTGLAYLSCGSGNTIAYDIPVIIPRLVSYAIVALKTITPVILIIIGMFQLIKAITSQNDDEMKKAKSSLVKKLIAAVIIFFMVSIVQFVVSKVADDSEQSSLSACMSCFINNDCGKSMYYTDGYGNCYSVATKGLVDCPVADY